MSHSDGTPRDIAEDRRQAVLAKGFGEAVHYVVGLGPGNGAAVGGRGRTSPPGRHPDATAEQAVGSCRKRLTSSRRLFFVLFKLVDRVGGVFERFVEFVQFLGGVVVEVVLELFHSCRCVVDVGCEFVEFT